MLSSCELSWRKGWRKVEISRKDAKLVFTFQCRPRFASFSHKFTAIFSQTRFLLLLVKLALISLWDFNPIKSPSTNSTWLASELFSVCNLNFIGLEKGLWCQLNFHLSRPPPSSWRNSKISVETSSDHINPYRSHLPSRRLESRLIIRIDVSKQTVDTCFLGSRRFSIVSQELRSWEHDEII